MSSLIDNVVAPLMPSYIASTFFDKDSWSKLGVNWLRKAKLNQLTGFVLGSNLPIDAEVKIKELGFSFVPILKKYGDKRDFYHTIAEILKKGQQCLFTYPDVDPRGNLPEKQDVFCKKDSSNIFEVVSPIKNLKNRANCVELIGNRLLSPRYILGSWKFWIGYSGFQNYICDKKYLEFIGSYDILLFNLYMTLFKSVSLEIENDA